MRIRIALIGIDTGMCSYKLSVFPFPYHFVEFFFSIIKLCFDLQMCSFVSLVCFYIWYPGLLSLDSSLTSSPFCILCFGIHREHWHSRFSLVLKLI